MILRVLAVSMIGLTLAGCVSSSGLSGDVYSASEAKQVQSVTYGTIVHTRAVQIQSGDDSNAIGPLVARCSAASLVTPSAAVPVALLPPQQAQSPAA
jgi:Outer membrane lipoprotein